MSIGISNVAFSKYLSLQAGFLEIKVLLVASKCNVLFLIYLGLISKFHVQSV